MDKILGKILQGNKNMNWYLTVIQRYLRQFLFILLYFGNIINITTYCIKYLRKIVIITQFVSTLQLTHLNKKFFSR